MHHLKLRRHYRVKLLGNVMRGLTSLGHEAGNSGNDGRLFPKPARTVFLSDLSILFLTPKLLGVYKKAIGYCVC